MPSMLVTNPVPNATHPLPYMAHQVIQPCFAGHEQLGGGMVNPMCSGASRNGMVANEMLRYPSQGLRFTGINPSAMVGSGMGTDQSGMGLQGITPPIVPSMHMPTGLLPPVAMPSGMAPMAMAGAAMSASIIPPSAIATKSAVASASAMSMAMA